MNKDQAIENFVLSKTAVQMAEAVLEENAVEKFISFTQLDSLVNDLNFGYRIEVAVGGEIYAYMKTTIVSREKDGTMALKISVTYRGKFIAVSEVDEKDFEEFVEIQTIPQLLPYTRSFITSLTAYMGLEPIILPTMDIIQSLIDNSTDDEEEA